MLTSAKDHLQKFGISMEDALTFIVTNIGQHQVIYQALKSVGVTTRMVAEILQQAAPEKASKVVQDYFAGAGLDYVELDQPDFAAIKASSVFTQLTDGNDNFTGTDASDYIRAGIGGDEVDGSGGADFLFGEGGDDRLSGGFGVDFLEGGDGNDHIFGFGVYYDWSVLDDCSPNVLFGNAGSDVLIGGYGDDHLYGGEGNDVLYDETIVIEASFDPKDRFEVEVNGNDWLDGGSGDDVLYSKGGFDNLMGGEGNDVIRSYSAYGFSRIDGGAGNDEIFFSQGDQVSGGDGNDKIYYASAVYGKSGPNPYAGNSIVVAGEGADVLYFSGFSSLRADSVITVDLTETTSRVDVIGGVGFYSKPASPALVVEGFSVGVDEIDISSASVYGAGYSVGAVGALSENLGLINYAQIMTSADEVYRQPVSSSLKSPDDYGKAFFVVQGASVAAPDAISVAQFLDAYGHNATYGKSAEHYFMLNAGDKNCALYYFADDNQGNNQVAADELTPVLLLSGVRTEDFSAADLAYTFI